MLQSILNFVYNKFTNGLPPVDSNNPNRKRRFEGDNEEPQPVIKYQKIDPWKFQNMSMNKEIEIINCNKPIEKSKENIKARISKPEVDEECCVVAEVPSRWRSDNTLSSRRAIKPLAASTPLITVTGGEEKKQRQPLIQTQYEKVTDNEIQVVKHVRNIPTQTEKIKPNVSRTSERIFRPFRSSSDKIIKAKSLTSFSIMKPRGRMQNETFRLAEKAKYWAYLQMQLKTFTPSNFKLKELGLRRAIKPPIPVIDLEKEVVSVQHDKEIVPVTRATVLRDVHSEDDDIVVLKDEPRSFQPLQRVNSLEDILKTYPVTHKDFVRNIEAEHSRSIDQKRKSITFEETKLKLCRERKKFLEDALAERVKEYMKVTEPAEEVEEIEEEIYELPELTKEQEGRVTAAFKGANPNEVLSRKFGMDVRRKDIITLQGLKWLNDEVINFYMNLLIERSQQGSDLPKVYAFNTFFSPNIVNKGYISVRRWTKKVDIFEQDLVVVPVHLGMHWCLAVVDFRDKSIRYYDSMGSPNPDLLKSLKKYLEEESVDKKKQAYDTSSWKCENMQNIPQQMNGSDCGVFACTFAEHITRNCPLAFNQELMPYFRKKMVVEILDGKLIT